MSSHSSTYQTDRLLPLTDGWLDLMSGTAHRGRRLMRLTSAEHQLLSYLVEHEGQVFSVAQLLTDVWGYHPNAKSNTVRTTVARMRKKLEVGGVPRHVVLVDRGYAFERAAEPLLLPLTGLLVGVRTTDSSAGPDVLEKAIEDLPHGFPVLDLAGIRCIACEDEDGVWAWVEGRIERQDDGVGVVICPMDGQPPHYAGRGRDILERLLQSVPPGRVLSIPDPPSSLEGHHDHVVDAWVIDSLRRSRSLPVRTIPAGPTWATRWIGRDALEERLRSALKDPGIIVVHGPPGAGKTRLTARAAREGPDPVFCDLGSAVERSDIVARLAVSLGVRGSRSTEASIAVALQSRPRTVVLDNAELVASDLAHLLKDWSVAASGCRWVVTTRLRVDVAGARLVPVGPLEPGAARELLQDRVDAAGGALNPADADGLVALLDRLPLAIELGATRYPILGGTGLSDGLRARFEMLRGGQGRFGSLEAALEWSWEQLPGWAQDALGQLSVFPGPVAIPDVARVVDLRAHSDAPVLLEVLDTLLAHALVRTEAAPVRCLVQYPSIRAFARTRVDTADARDRHMSWMYSEVETFLVEREGPDDQVALRRLTRLSSDLHAAFDHAIDRDLARAATLARAWEVLTLRQGTSPKWQRALDQLVQRAEVKSLNWSRALVLRGFDHYRTGNRRAALADLQASLDAAEALGHDELIATARLRLSSADTPAITEAAMARRALAAEAYEQTGMLATTAVALSELASLRQRMGHPGAQSALEAATRVQSRSGARWSLIRLYQAWAIRLSMDGDTAAAIRELEGALVLARELEDHVHEAHLLQHRSILRRRYGDLAGSVEDAETAIGLHAHAGSNHTTFAYATLGETLLQLGEADRSRDAFRMALDAARNYGNQRLPEATATCMCGVVEEFRGNRSRALALLRQGLDVLATMPVPARTSKFLAALAGLQADLDQIDAAKKTLKRARSLLVDDDPGALEARIECLAAEGRLCVASGDREGGQRIWATLSEFASFSAGRLHLAQLLDIEAP